MNAKRYKSASLIVGLTVLSGTDCLIDSVMVLLGKI